MRSLPLLPGSLLIILATGLTCALGMVAFAAILPTAAVNASQQETPTARTAKTADPYFKPNAALAGSTTRSPQTSNAAKSTTSESDSSTAKKINAGSTSKSAKPTADLIQNGSSFRSQVQKASAEVPEGSDTGATSIPATTPDQEMEMFEPTRVLARVGGKPIFVSDMAVEAMQILDQFIGSAPAAVKKREMKNLIPRLLPKYIQSKLLLVDALEGLPEEADIDGIYESAGEQFNEHTLPMLMENIKVKSPAELDAYYRALGSSLRNVRRSWVESELVKFTMRSKINVNPAVSHREMYEFYQKHKGRYAKPAKVKWEQLRVRFANHPSREQAILKLAEMGDAVVFGAKFEAVAREKSEGHKSDQGGQQGWTTQGSLVDTNLEQALFSIDIGKLSTMIPIRDGMVIVRVIDRQQAGFVSFQKAQGEIEEEIRNKKREAEFQSYVNKVKERIPVQVFDPDFLAANPDDKSIR